MRALHPRGAPAADQGVPTLSWHAATIRAPDKILADRRSKLGTFEVVLRTLEKVYPGGPGGI